MATSKALWTSFNRGIVSALGRARIEIRRVGLSASEQTNWMPRVLGPMMLRPGLEFIDYSKSSLKARLLSFQFDVDDTAQIELTSAGIRVRTDDALITRPTLVAVVANSGFDTNLTSWTDSDDAGGTSAWFTGGYMSLIGDGGNYARRRQEVTIGAGEGSVVHSLRIIIKRGFVQLRIGKETGGDDILSVQTLREGEHSITFITPKRTSEASSFWIELAAEKKYASLVDSCAIDAPGAMSIPMPYGASELRNVRYWQSGDIIFMAGGDEQQYNIERRDDDSWSVVKFQPVDGPFRNINVTKITIASDAIDGDVTLTASKSIFKQDHVGALFRLDSVGQTVTQTASAVDVVTDPIRITGGETPQREFNIVLSGFGSATITLQRSQGRDGPWNDLSDPTPWTANVTTTHDDEFADQIWYYRLKCTTYGSGTITMTLSFDAGSITGVARIDSYSSGTSVGAHVLKGFGSTTATQDWYEGEWSEFRKFPSATNGYEGRNWYAGRDKIHGSVSDAYYSYDDSVLGDGAPIQRQIGSGPIRIIHWIASLGRLLLGTTQNSANVAAVEINANQMLSARSNSFDEPLTPRNFNMKTANSKAIFVDRTKQRLYELALNSVQGGAFDNYGSVDLSVLTPDLNRSGIIHIAAQQKPDVRIHCVRNDGKVALLVFDRAEEVSAWIIVETDGTIEDVSVLPDIEEDSVYYLVKRTVGGSQKRCIEKWAMEYDSIGNNISNLADSFVAYSGLSTTSITGLENLETEKVVIWADGKDVSIYDSDGLHTGPTVVSGAITLTTAAAKVCVGRPYRARYRSSSLLNMETMHPGDVQRIEKLALSLYRTHNKGLKYGPDFDNLSDLPQVLDGEVVTADTILGSDDIHQDKYFSLGGEWGPDSRVCLEANAPRPVTVLGMTVKAEVHEG